MGLSKIALILVALNIANVYARPGYAHGGSVYAAKAVDYYHHPKYAFKYGVSDPHTGDHKSQVEHRDGDVVRGQYSLVEPDGSIRTVDYTADPVHGFNAVVSKSAPQIHHTPVKVPLVHAPAPSIVKVPVKVLPAVPAVSHHSAIAPVVPIVKKIQPITADYYGHDTGFYGGYGSYGNAYGYDHLKETYLNDYDLDELGFYSGALHY